MITLALKLLLSHLMGDFLFQPTSWVQDKEQKKHKSVYLYIHIAIHTVLLLVILLFNMTYWVGILITIISHFIIDLLKTTLNQTFNKRVLFFADQILHLLIIALVVGYYHPYKVEILFLQHPIVLLFIVSIISTTIVTSVLMKTIISRWDIQDDSDSLEMAGAYIGMLERTFVFIFIISNHWEGIGFLLAAKSVFRYGDLSKTKDRKLTEYILIGTLISFGFAILIGIGYTYISELIEPAKTLVITK
ncbi:DUF3307 domain-containing protein [Aquimarina pacifica]|uniref:DUF3307 domain-containing protein n=1 Tax=Aquimarina pacifica TaxID=1296415 RepID=UPI00046F1C92|nr:DUF3307 domain-containing protein [Aquimarina pacifica]